MTYIHISQQSEGDVVDWSGLRLSQEQVDQFWRDGYLSNIPVLSEKQCELLLSDYKTFLVRHLYLYIFILQKALVESEKSGWH